MSRCYDRRAAALVLFVLACSESPPEPPAATPRDAATKALYDSIGPYIVEELTAPQGAYVVVAADVNDSGVVVGYQAGAPPYQQAFRWRHGVYQLLTPAPSRAIAINANADVVGVTTVPMFWQRGQGTGEDFLHPDSARLRSGTPSQITASGRIMIVAPGGATLLAPGTHAVELKLPADHANPVVNDAGRVVARGTGVSPYQTLYTYIAGASGCAHDVHGLTRAFEMTDDNQAVVTSTVTSAPGFHGEALILSVAPRPPGVSYQQCAESEIDIGREYFTKPEGEAVVMRTLNAAGWMAGTVFGLQSVVIRGIPAYAPLDSVLIDSGGDAARWRVDSVIKVNRLNQFLAIASAPGRTKVPVLLTPKP